MNITIKCDCGNEDTIKAKSDGNVFAVTHDPLIKPIYLFTEGANIKVKCLACNIEKEL